MDRSFYHFALRFRGGGREDDKSVFADKMFLDAGFPKTLEDFDSLSRYIEEMADDDLRSTTFDDIYEIYKELCSL